MSAPQVVALAGVGNLGRYVCEELISDDRFEVIVISRKKHKFLEDYNVNVQISDYSEDSVLSILNSCRVTALISFINCPHDLYIGIHTALLNACARSDGCKRFIPSEWAGNIDDYPSLPRFYAAKREPFRQILRGSEGVEWTLFNCGWLMDYFLPAEKTYMPPIPDEFPVDPNNWRCRIRGTGDEPQSWTCAREIGRAVVELLAAPEWEPTTYVAGEWSTFNKAVKTMETLRGRPLEKSFQSSEDIQRSIVKHADDSDASDRTMVDMDEWIITGASACPKDKTLRQREEYFSKTRFSTLEELLQLAENVSFV